MMIFAQTPTSFDWQAIAVVIVVSGALVYLVARNRRKKQSCGTSSCSCVKKK